MTFVLDGRCRSGKLLQRNTVTKTGSVRHSFQALFPLLRRLLLMRGLLWKSCALRPLLLLLPFLQEGRLRVGGLGMHLVLRPVRLPLLDLGPARGVEVFLVAHPVRASALLPPRLLRERGRGKLLVRGGRPLPAPLPWLPLPAHHSTLCDVVGRESLRRSAPVLDPPVFPDLRIEEQGRIVGPALGRTALVTGPVVLTLALLPARGRERWRRASSRSLSSCERLRRDRSRSRRVCSRSRGERSRSSDRYRSRRDCFRRDRSRSSDRYRSRRQRSHSPVRRGGRRDRSRSPPASDRLRLKEGGRRARREKQEVVETVTVSQAPVVSEAAAVVAPVGGTTVAALPSAVQDLVRFFLSLAGSSSLGAVGDVVWYDLLDPVFASFALVKVVPVNLCLLLLFDMCDYLVITGGLISRCRALTFTPL